MHGLQESFLRRVSFAHLASFRSFIMLGLPDDTRHRQPSSHSCVPLQGQNAGASVKNAKARELLNKHFPSTRSASTTAQMLPKKTVVPRKQAQIKQVQLMKMRHKAKPGDTRDKPTSVSIDQRLHLQVSNGDNPSSTLLWFRKVNLTSRSNCIHSSNIFIETIVTGKVIDLLASHFNVSSNVKVRLGPPSLTIMLSHPRFHSRYIF